MKTLRVLLIDDDEKLADLLKKYLTDHAIKLHAEAHPHSGKEALKRFRPDVLLLDVMMPDQDGFDLCQEIRKSDPDLPIIMLTARGDVTDRVVGLELGADDYLPKPFEPRELAARIRTLSRRTSRVENGGSPVLRFGDLEVNLSERNAYLKGRALDLTTAEYELLRLLAQKSGKKFSRDEIMNALSGIDADVYSRSIDVLVSRLRNKLGDTAKAPKFIKTVWGTGYVFLNQGTPK